jgi:hypothetical protein
VPRVAPQFPKRRPQRRPDLLQIRDVPSLELRTQPVHVGQDLTAQRPAFRSFGGVGAEQVGQPVLLAPRLLQVVFEFLGDRLGRHPGQAPAGQASVAKVTNTLSNVGTRRVGL